MQTPSALTTTAITPDLLPGALDIQRTEHGVLPHRLPAHARAHSPDGQLAMAEAQPSGVRLAFRTRATTVELDTLRTTIAYEGAPPRPNGVYDLLVDGHRAAQASTSGGNVLTVDMATGSAQTRPGAPGTVLFAGLSADMKNVEIWLPHNEMTQLDAMRTDAPVEPVKDRTRRVWLHHGSSISQGSDAASPSTTWPALAAARGNVELVNLEFGGSAMLDPFTARAMRDTSADLISIKINHALKQRVETARLPR
ncbi:SGNH/GDSL hydrolase family protein [Micromonospora sp. NPDC049799]|uniref:SGNH/GDSL hydrolase family protein n=1 Tax=Micromonospora sp. NPDC049799 TaxID=3154741 RepID=UPI0033EAFA55